MSTESESLEALPEHAPFDKRTSPYHLTYCCDGVVLWESFDDLPELCQFVVDLKLRWADYSIIHGEVVKSLQPIDLRPEAPEDITEQDCTDLESIIWG